MKNMSQILDLITSPVSIVTSKAGEKINGMTVAWIAQVSLSPTLLMVAISPDRYTSELIHKSGVFAVSLLAAEQIEVARHFGSSSGRMADKFKGISYVTKVTGSPVLKDIYGYIDCKLVSDSKAGDHIIYVGEVLESQVFKNKAPLIFRSKDYF